MTTRKFLEPVYRLPWGGTCTPATSHNYRVDGRDAWHMVTDDGFHLVVPKEDLVQEHVEPPLWTVLRCANALKPGGDVFQRLEKGWLRLGASEHDGHHYDGHHYTWKGLRAHIGTRFVEVLWEPES